MWTSSWRCEWRQLTFHPYFFSFFLWVDSCQYVSGPQLQRHLITKHLAVHHRSERSCHTFATVPGMSCIYHVSYLPSPDILGAAALPSHPVLSFRFWWSCLALPPCRDSYVEYSCQSVFPKVASFIPAAQSVPQLRHNAVTHWSACLSAGPSTATSFQTLRTKWIAPYPDILHCNISYGNVINSKKTHMKLLI